MKSMTDQYSNAHFFDTYDLFVNPQSSEISINLPGTGIIWQAGRSHTSAAPAAPAACPAA